MLCLMCYVQVLRMKHHFRPKTDFIFQIFKKILFRNCKWNEADTLHIYILREINLAISDKAGCISDLLTNGK